jgi:hypothetical protein
MRRTILIVSGLFLTALLSGCSTYVDDYYFGPRPARAEIPATQPDQPPPVSALASIIGVHRADSQEGIPESVEVRLRVENTGANFVSFDPQSLELSDGAFVMFPRPVLRPPQAWTLPPGQMALLAAYFPFPPGKSWDSTDLQSLELRWDVQIDGHLARQVVLFNRVFPDYYYTRPYYYGPYPYVGGVVVVRRRF